MCIFFSLLLYFIAVSLCSHHFSSEYTYENPSQQLRFAGLESWPSKTRSRNTGGNLSPIKWQLLHNSFILWGIPGKMQNLSCGLLQHSQWWRKSCHDSLVSSLGSCGTWGAFENTSGIGCSRPKCKGIKIWHGSLHGQDMLQSERRQLLVGVRWNTDN